MKILSRITALACSLLLLSACGGPETPQEVTETFWTAVSENDSDAVVEYSTLNDPAGYDRFARDDWADVKLSWGKVVIDETEASIVTEVARPGEPEDEKLSFSTYLVRQGETWKVDYARTADDLRASSALDNIFRKVNAFGREVSDQFDKASRELDRNLKSMTEQFRALSESVKESTSENVERYGDELRRQMGELADSIDRALKEHEGRLSGEDEKTLLAVSNDLHESSEGSDSIAENGSALTSALQRLEEVDSRVIDDYRAQWQEWRENMEVRLQELVQGESGGRV